MNIIGFFAKLNSSGEIEWAKKFDTPGQTDVIRTIIHNTDNGLAIKGKTIYKKFIKIK